VSVNNNFGTCIGVSVHIHIWDTKMFTLTPNLRILSLASVPFTLTTVQVPNLAQVETKRITVRTVLLNTVHRHTANYKKICGYKGECKQMSSNILYCPFLKRSEEVWAGLGMSRTRENSVSGSPTSAEQVSVSSCSFMVFLCSNIVFSYNGGGGNLYIHRELVRPSQA
jgi:hypothetical protein